MNNALEGGVTCNIACSCCDLEHALRCAQVLGFTVSGGSPGWMAPMTRMPNLASRPPAHTAAMLTLATVMGPKGASQFRLLRFTTAWSKECLCRPTLDSPGQLLRAPPGRYI